MAIETGLIALGAAIGAKDLIVKMFGPTADFFGRELAEFNKKRLENLKKIFKKAESKLGDRLDSPELIPPVVLKEIVDYGSLYEEDIYSEYFSGVLASSRTPEGKDDRGKTYSQIIHRLSRYQLRAHYVIYSLLKEKYNGIDNCCLLTTMENMVLNVKSADFNKSLDLNHKEKEEADTIVSHIMSGLQREFLISQNWSIQAVNNSTYVLNVCPEVNGYELFLWGQGEGGRSPSCFTDIDLNFNAIEGVFIPSLQQ